MVRYTTPTLVLTVPRDLTGCDVYVSLRQGKSLLNIKADNVVCGESSTIVQELTQEQTAIFKAWPVIVQVNWITASGVRYATKQRQVQVRDNLYEEVISND